MTPRDRLLRIIDDWADEPDSLEDWDSVLKVNILIQSEKEFGIKFNMADVPGITGLTTLLAFLEPRIASKKVLVLDCDGVLWNGIIGEGHAVVSIPFMDAQREFVRLESQGVLLCLCSKNNPQDVHDAFTGLTVMPLRQNHIVAEEISWDSKVDGLKRLAAKLNLGLDSFVFMDDSPHERQEVRERLPEVTVKIPYDAMSDGTLRVRPLADLFTHLPGKSLTEQYRQAINARKDEIRYSTLDVSPLVAHQRFLDSLDMRAVMRMNDESLAPRIAELSQKTNQFNMCLRRFTEKEIRGKMNSGKSRVFCASLVDRFGDAGWVAQAVFSEVLEIWLLEDFCVSCRVLGRGFERAFIEKCMAILAPTNPPYFQWTYTPGPKNQQCANFFSGQNVADHVPRAPVKWEE